MSYDEQTSIKALGLSARATNALIRNRLTTVKDLMSVSESTLYSMRGIGVTVLNEIQSVRKALEEMDYSLIIKEIPKYSFGEYLKNSCRNERTFFMLVEYYNNYSRGAMKVFADKYAITRSRIQQIIAKCTDRLCEAYAEGAIKDDVVSRFDDYAVEKTEIHTIKSVDPYFSGFGLAHLVSNFKNSKYQVFRNNNLNGEWLVFSDDNIESTFESVLDDLKHRSEPLLISTVEQLYGINEKMLMSIKGIIEKQGYVTHENNKHSTGRDRNFIIRKYLENVDRPASIEEITNNTSLGFQQVRGAIGDKTRYINVGKSVYDLVDRKYEDKSIDELASMLLVAEDRALKIEYIASFIKKYREVADYSIAYTLLNSPIIKNIGDYYLLSDWSADKIEKRTLSNYSICLDDAILEIISSSDEIYDYEKVAECLEKYGDAVSHIPSSIKTTLARLADKKIIKRIGGVRTGCYMRIGDEQFVAKNKNAPKTIEDKLTMGIFINSSIGENIEIRYKTNRVNSEKHWRTISVRGQDARYVYTNDMNNYGQRIKYVKEKIIDYREITSPLYSSKGANVSSSPLGHTANNWHDDVLGCVNELGDAFTLQEMYGFEKELSMKHPENLNVKAKIRQQLQVLRDESIIEMVVPGIYQKK